jgi:translation initiation factor IF-2
VDVVKRDAAKYNLMPEEWGGSTVFVPISAKTGAGVDALLEIVALQAQLMELKANPNLPAKGFILESKIEKGRGSVATIMCHEGTVRTGDYFTAGTSCGRITSMIDSMGRRVTQALPSHPVQIAGFEDLPAVGDLFTVVTEAEYRTARVEGVHVAPVKTFARENAINVIVKAEGSASLEAAIAGLSGFRGLEKKGIRNWLLSTQAWGQSLKVMLCLPSHLEQLLLGFMYALKRMQQRLLRAPVSLLSTTKLFISYLMP